jgi:uncharacterized protein
MAMRPTSSSKTQKPKKKSSSSQLEGLKGGVGKVDAGARSGKIAKAKQTNSKPASKSAPLKASASAAKPKGSDVKPSKPSKTKSASAKVASPAASAKVPNVEAKAAKRIPRAKSSIGVPAVAPKPSLSRKAVVKANKGTGRPEMLRGELPQEYGVDRLVAIPRDPDWTHLYWELAPETRQKLSGTDGGFRLRGFDTTGILFDGRNAPVALDVELAPYARSWYVKLPYQGRVYTFEYGMVNRDGEWTGLARSQPVGFEPGMLGLSPDSEEWISIASDELFRAASGLGDGEGIQDLIRRLRERSAGSGAFLGSSFAGESGAGMLGLAPSSSLGSSAFRLNLPTSYMSSSMGSGTTFTGLSSGEFQPPKDKSKDFWLWVETELILYGATEPDAQVTLMGKPLQLNPDGTFRVHFPFPNGTELHMDVRAVDRSGEMERTARPAAKRWTN